MKQKFRIPDSFQLHGITFAVRYDSNLCRDTDHTGEARYRTAEIVLNAPNTNWPPQNLLDQTFCHELVHMILNEMQSKLHSDESHVDLFASLLHQFLITAEYGEDTK